MYILILLILVIYYSLPFIYDYISPHETEIDDDGYVTLDIFNEDQVNYLTNLIEVKEYDKAEDFIKKTTITRFQDMLGEEYVFLDYMLSQEKSKVSMCRRDQKMAHPSYTIMFYLKNTQNCLGIIEKSHVNTSQVYLTDQTKTLPCKVGQAILFNSSMIHTTTENDTTRVQMKILHKDDVEKYKKILQVEKETHPFLKRLSCQIPDLPWKIGVSGFKYWFP